MAVRVETFDRIEDAARALAGHSAARFLGGGTLVMRAVNEGGQFFDTIIRTRDASLKDVRAEGDGITIGAGVSMAGVIANRDLAFLAPVARSVGGPAIRNMATVGGNLFARSPYGDFATALLALGAVVNMAEQSGRGIPIDDFLRDRQRHRGALVRSVWVPRPRDPGAFRFAKVSRVKPKGISVMSIAAYLPGSAGRIQGARVAYGAMGPAPLRANAVERTLEGQSLDAAAIDRAASVAAEGIEPPTDALASSWYRKEVVGVHLKRLLSERR